MKRQALLFIGLAALASLAIGCGTAANLAGASLAVNVAQKGMVAGVTLAGGTNSVNVGVSYAQGTNAYSADASIPTK